MKQRSIRRIISFILITLLFLSGCSQMAQISIQNQGDQADSRGVAVEKTIHGRLTGVNWFGFETGNYAPHGLWSRDYRSMLKQIHDLGFNCVRIPWCNAMLQKTPVGIQINASGVDNYTKEIGMNTDLEGLTSIEVLDKIVEEAGRVGLKIILDNHSREADGYMNESLWYTDTFTEEQWITDWVFMANRYKNSPQVVAADLNNEPHGNNGMGSKPPAGWGVDHIGYPHTDWKAAAEKCGLAILDVNPQLLIMVEGVEEVNGETYWWGGNLSGVKEFPITAIPAENLVYSPHEYGPEVFEQEWFTAADFPSNLPALWDNYFWFIYKDNIAPLLFGEFGIKEASAADPSSTSYIWFTEFMKYVGYKSSWTFWCMNPNSGDTGGILQNDWVSINTAKYNLIKPYLEPLEPSTPVDPDTTAPAVPSGLMATSITAHSLELIWSAVTDSDLANYRLYRGSSLADLSYVGSSITSNFQELSLAAETTYVYAVSAVDISGNESEKSALCTVLTQVGLPVSASLRLQHQSSDSGELTNTLGFKVKVINEGESAVDLSKLTIRYYFTGDNDSDFSFWCDYAGGQLAGEWETITSSVAGNFLPLVPLVPTADTFLEISFGSTAGFVQPQGFAEVQCRITHSDWTSFNQANDFSFSENASMMDSQTIAVYLDGNLVSGAVL